MESTVSHVLISRPWKSGGAMAAHPLREGRLLNPELELLDAAGRRAYLDARLRATARIGLEELGQKPTPRKDTLSKMQAEDPPLAGLLAGPVSRLRRMFASPGPTYVPQGSAIDYWRFGMAFAACGMRAGDVVMNTLSYHLTPGAFMLDSGLRSLGCAVWGGWGWRGGGGRPWGR